MTRRFAFYLYLFLCSSFVSAHEVSIHPVDINLQVEPKTIRVRIETAAAYWLIDILDVTVPPPATGWPASLQSISKATIEKSFQLSVDGRPLVSSTFQCRYIEEPLRFVTPRVRFDLVYLLESKGQILSGRSHFFVDEYEEHLRDPSGGLSDKEEGYGTRLTLSGKDEKTIELPIDKPDFRFPLSDLMKTSEQYAKESFKAAFGQFLLNPFWILLCLAIVAILRGLLSRSTRVVRLTPAVIVLLVSGSFLASLYIKGKNPAVAWAALALVAAPYAVKKSGTVSLIFLSAASLLIWPGIMAREMAGLPYASAVSWAVKPAYLGGTLAAGISLSLTVRFTAWLYKKRLTRMYESVAENMLISHLRAACGFVFFISVAQVIKYGLEGARWP